MVTHVAPRFAQRCFGILDITLQQSPAHSGCVHYEETPS